MEALKEENDSLKASIKTLKEENDSLKVQLNKLLEENQDKNLYIQSLEKSINLKDNLQVSSGTRLIFFVMSHNVVCFYLLGLYKLVFFTGSSKSKSDHNIIILNDMKFKDPRTNKAYASNKTYDKKKAGCKTKKKNSNEAPMAKGEQQELSGMVAVVVDYSSVFVWKFVQIHHSQEKSYKS